MGRNDTQRELKDLKDGDKVYYSSGLYGGDILTITKITPTMIKCGNLKFRRGSGGEIGNSNCWSFPTIQMLTQELKDDVTHNRLSSYLSHLDFTKLKLEQLREIRKIVKVDK